MRYNLKKFRCFYTCERTVMMKCRLLAMLLISAVLAGCSNITAQSLREDADSQTPASVQHSFSTAEEVSPSSEETLWTLLTQEEAVDFWRSLGADKQKGFSGRWFFSCPESLFETADQIVSIFSISTDGMLSYISGYDATDSGWSYNVKKVETDGTAYRIVMADVGKGLTTVRTKFEEEASPFLIVVPGESGDGKIEMEWTWPACVEELTGEQSYGELTGIEDITFYRVPENGEHSKDFDDTGRNFFPGAGHTKAASLEKGTYSPEETTGMQNFTYRLNDW